MSHGYGVGWKESAVWSTGQMKRYFKWWMKKITYGNNPKATEKLAVPHTERRLPSKNYNRGKNGREKERKMLLDWMMKEEYSKLKGRAMIRSVVYGSEQGRYLNIRGFLDTVVNGAIGHMNLPRKAENQ